jgi:hypothetical protein
MKKLMLFASLLLLQSATLLAGDPIWNQGKPSNLTPSYTTLIVGSTNYSTIAAATDPSGYRLVRVIHPSDTSIVYYEMDSTTTITTTGFCFQGNLGQFFETNKAINFQTIGQSSITYRVETLAN